MRNPSPARAAQAAVLRLVKPRSSRCATTSSPKTAPRSCTCSRPAPPRPAPPRPRPAGGCVETDASLLARLDESLAAKTVELSGWAVDVDAWELSEVRCLR